MATPKRFFEEEIREISVRSAAASRAAADELYEDVQRQIRRNFKNPSAAFAKGIKVSHFEAGSYVRLSPILSGHAQESSISGSPNLWILLPDGARLGFKRIGKGFNWLDLRRRFGAKLSFVPVSNGHVVLFRSQRGVVPIYKIQKQVKTVQRITFFESAERIARIKNFEVF